jgi:hypothetical protein
MLRVLFFHANQSLPRFQVAQRGVKPVTRAGLGDRCRVALTRSDEVFGAVRCWTNE